MAAAGASPRPRGGRSHQAPLRPPALALALALAAAVAAGGLLQGAEGSRPPPSSGYSAQQAPSALAAAASEGHGGPADRTAWRAPLGASAAAVGAAAVRGSSMLAVEGNISHSAAMSTQEAAFQATARRSGLLKAFMEEVHSVIFRESVEPDMEPAILDGAASQLQNEGQLQTEGQLRTQGTSSLKDDDDNTVIQKAQKAYDTMTSNCQLSVDGSPVQDVEQRASKDIVDELAKCTASLTDVGNFVQEMNGRSGTKNTEFASHFRVLQLALKKFKDLDVLMKVFDTDHEGALNDLLERAESLKDDVELIDPKPPAEA